MKDHFMTESQVQNEKQKKDTLRTHKQSRRLFLRGSVVGASIVVPAGLMVACGSASSTVTSTQKSSASTGTDNGSTQTYTALALKSAMDSKNLFIEIMDDENQHVTALKDALTKAGATPRPKPTFKGLNMSDLNTFVNQAQIFENVGVGAYLMAAPAISDKGYLAAAGSILTIEARHAGFLNALQNKPLSANGPFDKPLTVDEIVTDVSPFITSLNGGSDPSKPLKSDVDILNFALLLEYLEAEFYSMNVPNLFK